MRRQTVVTKMRPFRKVFVIDGQDKSAFINVLGNIAGEVDGYRNLILPVDALFFSAVTADLIRRYDPDIIFNLSQQSCEDIESRFDAKCVTPDNEAWRIARFATSLSTFRSAPQGLMPFGDIFPRSVYATGSVNRLPDSFFGALNFGLVEDVEVLHLDFTVFKGLAIEEAPDAASAVGAMFGERRTFWGLCEDAGFGSGNGSSIWEQNHNPNHDFWEGKYAFIGSEGDVSSLCYFWNMRATYGVERVFWISAELTDRLDFSQHSFSAVVVRDKHGAELATQYLPGVASLRPHEYIFGSANDRWKVLEHMQDVVIEDDKLSVQHPASKTFSEIGLMGAAVLELRGVPELAYPVGPESWGLLAKVRPYQFHAEGRFTRYSALGVSQYILQVALEMNDTLCEVYVPSLLQWVQHRFAPLQLTLRPTAKTSLFQQLDRLLSSSNGCDPARVVATRRAFRLVQAMTPVVRTDKITKALNVTMEADRVKSAIEQGISSGAIDLPVICMSVKQMCDSVGVAKTQRNSFFEDVQALYDSRVLLRGKDITCPHCLSRIWLTIESVESRIHCPECGNGVNMPVVEEGDSYKLNRLVARALDQGQLATFLLMHFLRANFRIIDCFPNLEVFEGGALKTDVDLVVRLGRRVGLAECKSRSGFDNDQVDTLIQLAAASRCDFAILSTLLPKDAPEVRDSFERLLSRNLAFPVFFVTESALLGSERPSLTQFFEYGRAGIPHTGPIMV